MSRKLYLLYAKFFSLFKTASAKINHYPLGLCSICFGIQKIKSHVIHKRVFSITKNEFPESFFQIQRRDRYIISKTFNIFHHI